MKRLPPRMRLVGYLTLLPFFILTLALLTKSSLPGLGNARLDWWLATYAALVLSFWGAVHWGFVLGMQDWLSEPDTRRLIQYSTAPAIAAWFTFLVPIKIALILLAILLALAYAADVWLLYDHIKRYPDYPRLRRNLTIIAVVLMLLAAIA